MFGVAPGSTDLADPDPKGRRIIVEPMVPSARRAVAKLRGAGADVVLALVHDGLDEQTSFEDAKHGTLALSRVAGIDAIVAGHSHRRFPENGIVPVPNADPLAGTINGIPVVMPAAEGAEIGVIDLLLTRMPAGWKVQCGRSSLAAPPISPSRVTCLPSLSRIAHQRTLRRLRKPVGETTVPISSFFAPIGISSAQRFVADALTAIAGPLLKPLLPNEIPILSAVPPFRMGGCGGPLNYTDIPAGSLLERHLADLCVYPNAVCPVVVDGSGLSAWLERTASVFGNVNPGEMDAPLVRSEVPSFGFDTVFGITYEIDLSQATTSAVQFVPSDAGTGRIKRLQRNGAPITQEDRFAVLTSSYRAQELISTGIAVPLKPSFPRLPIISALRQYVQLYGPVTPSSAPVWSFTRMAKTTALFDTGLGAEKFERDLPKFLEPLNQSEERWRRYRLHLGHISK